MCVCVLLFVRISWQLIPLLSPVQLKIIIVGVPGAGKDTQVHDRWFVYTRAVTDCACGTGGQDSVGI